MITIKRLRPLAFLLLLIPLSGQSGCPMNGGGGPSTLAVFTDSETGVTTTAVRDADEDILQFDLAANTATLVGDGLTAQGFVVNGTTITSMSDNKTFTVRFGTKNGNRRAYLTEGAEPGTVPDAEPANGEIIFTTSVLLIPDDVTTAQATGSGIYPIVGAGINGLFMFDIRNGYFLCSAAGGGTTIGTDGNFDMKIIGTGPIDRFNIGTILINGIARKRVQFTGRALSVTVNNNVPGFPGDDTGGEILVDELIECTYVAEAVEDPVGGHRWRTTIYDSTIWPDGSQFKNFEGDEISTGVVHPFSSGEISIMLP